MRRKRGQTGFQEAACFLVIQREKASQFQDFFSQKVWWWDQQMDAFMASEHTSSPIHQR
jgi:hypothetical protein